MMHSSLTVLCVCLFFLSKHLFYVPSALANAINPRHGRRQNGNTASLLPELVTPRGVTVRDEPEMKQNKKTHTPPG